MSFRRTPLFNWHVAHSGRMVEFGGWEMPVQYSSIVEEHQAVRNGVGLFDISHMGRLHFQGADAARFLDHLLTCHVQNLEAGQFRYGIVCNENGGILDDILVYRIEGDEYGMVVNAGNREKIVAWVTKQLEKFQAADFLIAIEFQDQTFELAMIAVQGRLALGLVQQIADLDFSPMPYYTGQSVEIDHIPSFVSRTGYTGEDGFELIVPQAFATPLWEKLIQLGASSAVKPCGLGCRDTLRLEAAMPLYGHELSENVDPITAGLGFAVKLDKPEFVGRESLISVKNQTDRAARVGLKLASRRIAREHAAVFVGMEQIGEVTSGTFSPTLEQSIAMAYIAQPYAKPGTAVEVDIRGKREMAEVVSLPFYKRTR